jgi:rod shape-determining protein MreB
MVQFVKSAFQMPDVAVDIGTAWIRVTYGGAGLHAVPSIFEGRNALRSGVIIDLEAVIAILRPLFRRIRRFGVLPPRVVACVPSDATVKEREAVRESVLRSGAADVCIVPEPLAAAIGSGLDVAAPFANMIVDIGEGVTDCAVIRSGKILDTHASRIGCAELRKALMKAAAVRMRNSAGRESAETLLRRIDVGGKTYRERFQEQAAPATISDDPCDEDRYVRAIEPLLEKIIDVARNMWGRIKPSYGSEIIENGIWLCGGGSLIKGMADRLEDAIRIRVNRAAYPLEAVVRGAHEMLPVVTALNSWKK